ncbi:MAG: formylglycine-generating enzyme family protein [Planctomycetota bacterium]|nr:MAG: formylglycine-generating enzyme family protein [Planctomycetota bacterium]
MIPLIQTRLWLARHPARSVTWTLCLGGALVSGLDWEKPSSAGETAAAAHAPAGFIAGTERPSGSKAAIQVAGGWMVPYAEKIPGTDVTFWMVPVPGGQFQMGSSADETDRTADEGPAFTVLVEPFWIGRYEVTWSEYKIYMAACDLFKAIESAKLRLVTPENEADAVTAPSNLYDPTTTFSNGEDPRQPAVTMTQFAARQYTQWLSGLTDRFYRLPLESEWEYACRADSTTPWHSGAHADSLESVAWFADTADETTHTVGEKEPNAWEIYDMHGNVAEWVLDELVPGGYSRQAGLPQPLPEALAAVWPTKLSPRIVRGGAFYDDAAQCRSAARRGSEDIAWKDIDPNLPKSPWWYTEEPALGIGMRIVRPLNVPDKAQRRRWWNADIDSIRADTNGRILQGRGARGIVDPQLPDEVKKAGLGG